MNIESRGNIADKHISDAMAELLKALSVDLDRDAVIRALRIIQSALGASRAYLMRLDLPRGMLKLVGEARQNSSVPALDDDYEYPAAYEVGWDKVTDENWIKAPDVKDPSVITRYGLNSEICDMLDIRSLYIIRFAAEGRNWGSLCVDYEGTSRELDETQWKFFVSAANLIQLAIVRDERLSALKAERDRAEAAQRAKSYFFSTVSHDIRTPLNAIVGYAELLKLGIADEVERKKAIDSVLVSSKTLLELINDVLDLSKLESGKMEILPEPVDPGRLVREVGDSFRASLGSKSVEIRVEVGPMPWLKLDPRRIRQILFNLVGNAVKFTQRGYVAIEAKYERGENRRGTLRFTVSDTGCGISEQDQLRIADPYVQVGNAASRNQGTGLGLAICRQLVAKMDGDIELESAPGIGTNFYVTLPQVEEEDGSRLARLSATQRIRFAVSEQAKAYHRVLIVDDQLMNRMMLESMLRRFGIGDIVMAVNGKEALSLLRNSNPFDLILTDMWMPELDGEGLVREIRQNPAWQMLPVYAVTADVEAQKDYRKHGFTGILLKPLTLEKMKELLKA